MCVCVCVCVFFLEAKIDFQRAMVSVISFFFERTCQKRFLKAYMWFSSFKKSIPVMGLHCLHSFSKVSSHSCWPTIKNIISLKIAFEKL